jgi:hypothetical protein
LPRERPTPRQRQRAGERPGCARTQTCPMIRRRCGPCRQKPAGGLVQGDMDKATALA